MSSRHQGLGQLSKFSNTAQLSSDSSAVSRTGYGLKPVPSESIPWKKFLNDSANDSLCRCACANVYSFQLQQTTKQKHSKAWLYFTQRQHDIATCNMCTTSISSMRGNTTNLMKHLNKRHGIHLGMPCVFDAACSSAANVSASLSQGIVKLLKSDHNHCVKQFAFIVRSRSSSSVPSFEAYIFAPAFVFRYLSLHVLIKSPVLRNVIS